MCSFIKLNERTIFFKPEQNVTSFTDIKNVCENSNLEPLKFNILKNKKLVNRLKECFIHENSLKLVALEGDKKNLISYNINSQSFVKNERQKPYIPVCFKLDGSNYDLVYVIVPVVILTLLIIIGIVSYLLWVSLLFDSLLRSIFT